MSRNGYKIFDSDTHVGPYMEVLDKYLSDSERARLKDWEQWQTVNKRGQLICSCGEMRFGSTRAGFNERRHGRGTGAHQRV